MNHESAIKDFSALSFEAGRVTNGTLSAIPDSLPRLTPESVRDFNVQHEGFASGDSPENDSLATTRHWQHAVVVLLLTKDSWLQESVHRALPKNTELMPVLHAEQAVQLSKQPFVDAILLDLDLGPAGGWRTAEQLLSGDAAVPLLLLARRSESLELAAAVRAGIVQEKPVDAARFRRTVRTLFSQSKEERLQHNARQHNFLRYAHPFAWRSSASSISRDGGLNE